jgi:hypothetical protein
MIEMFIIFCLKIIYLFFDLILRVIFLDFV